jgi:hypothetical protein
MRLLLLLQGGYYAATALWALLDADSFMAVTGPKTDVWLVKTVAALILTTSLPLLAASARSGPGPEILLLALGSATALACVDVVYVLERTIEPIYLLDAALQAVLIFWWLAHLSSLAARPSRGPSGGSGPPSRAPSARPAARDGGPS